MSSNVEVPFEGVALDGYINGVRVYKGLYSAERRELGISHINSLIVAKRNFLENKELTCGGVVWKFTASMLRHDPNQFEPTGDKETDNILGKRKNELKSDWRYEYLRKLREDGVPTYKRKYKPTERKPLSYRHKESIVDSLVEVSGKGRIFAPDGTYYKSSTKAAEAVRKSNSTIRRWCRDPKSDWRYKNEE